MKAAGPYSSVMGDTELLNYSDTYMQNVHDADYLVEKAEGCLKDVEFDTFVGIGLSGTIAAVELARQMGKNYLIVRKPTDGTHSNQVVEGKLGKRWVFVDDLVSSGATFRRVWEVLEGIRVGRGFQTEMVGCFLYNDACFDEFVPTVSDDVHRWLSYSDKYDKRYDPRKQVTNTETGETRFIPPPDPVAASLSKLLAAIDAANKKVIATPLDYSVIVGSDARSKIGATESPRASDLTLDEDSNDVYRQRIAAPPPIKVEDFRTTDIVPIPEVIRADYGSLNESTFKALFA